MRMEDHEARHIHEAMKKAGMEALEAATPEPMTVVDNRSGQRYHVSEGVCGFGWVTVFTTGENAEKSRAFINALKRLGLCSKRKNDGDYGKEWSHAYGGGFKFWIGAGGPSYDRKMEYARAAARVLTKNGITAYPGGRLD